MVSMGARPRPVSVTVVSTVPLSSTPCQVQAGPFAAPNAVSRNAATAGSAIRAGTRRDADRRRRSVREGDDDRGRHGAALTLRPDDVEAGRDAEPGRRLHRCRGVLAAAGDDVEHGVGDEQVAVGVEGVGERPEARQLGDRQPERRGIARAGSEDGLPVADAAAGVFDANRVLGAEPLDRCPVADHPFDRAAQRLRQMRPQADLAGELFGESHPVRVEVHVPAPGLGVGDGPVAEDRRGERLGLRRRVQVLGREGAAGHRGPRRVDPAVRSEVEPRRREGAQPPPREARGPRVDSVRRRVEGRARGARSSSVGSMPARLRAPSRAAWYSRLAADPPSCAGVNCVAHEAMVDASVSAAYGGSSSGSARPLARRPPQPRWRSATGARVGRGGCWGAGRSSSRCEPTRTLGGAVARRTSRDLRSSPGRRLSGTTERDAEVLHVPEGRVPRPGLHREAQRGGRRGVPPLHLVGPRHTAAERPAEGVDKLQGQEPAPRPPGRDGRRGDELDQAVRVRADGRAPGPRRRCQQLAQGREPGPERRLDRRITCGGFPGGQGRRRQDPVRLVADPDRRHRPLRKQVVQRPRTGLVCPPGPGPGRS